MLSLKNSALPIQVFFREHPDKF